MKKFITGMLLTLLCPATALAQSANYKMYDYAMDKLLEVTTSVLPQQYHRSTNQRRRDGRRVCTLLSTEAGYDYFSKQLREDFLKENPTDQDRSVYTYLVVVLSASKHICPESSEKIDQINIDIKNDLKSNTNDLIKDFLDLPKQDSTITPIGIE